jgi:hypothetical protein
MMLISIEDQNVGEERIRWRREGVVRERLVSVLMRDGNVEEDWVREGEGEGEGVRM